jgi:hypothetical protein
MKPIFGLIILVAMTLSSPNTNAQDTKVTYRFEKGHVIDFLLLTRKPDSDQALNDYARAAISEARALGYKGNGGFNLTRNPIQSNIHPESLVFGSWPGNFEDRETALKELLAAVPTLYEKRLDIWSSFYMTNYEIKEDVSFDVYHNKIQVLTSYWSDNTRKFEGFRDAYLKMINQYGGDIKLNLSDPKSPFGYDYTPDFTTLTEWDNQEAFDAFLDASNLMNRDSIKQVHQFYLTPPEPRK